LLHIKIENHIHVCTERFVPVKLITIVKSLTLF